MPRKAKINTSKEEHDLADLDITHDLENAAQLIRSGEITVIPSLYANDKLSLLFVSPKNFIRIKRHFEKNT